MLHFHIITLFPEVCRPYIESSILLRAQENRRIKVDYYDPRDHNPNERTRVDDKPYGGGPGMVITPLPVIKAIEKALGRKKQAEVIYFSPGGQEYSNQDADLLADNYRHLILVAGRYEGVDARVREVYPGREFSVGSFVLTGGELPALAVVDSVTRRLPGVLGDPESVEEGRVASRKVYTRPAEFRYRGHDYQVPEVLKNGDHQAIEEWRRHN